MHSLESLLSALLALPFFAPVALPQLPGDLQLQIRQDGTDWTPPAPGTHIDHATRLRVVALDHDPAVTGLAPGTWVYLSPHVVLTDGDLAQEHGITFLEDFQSSLAGHYDVVTTTQSVQGSRAAFDAFYAAAVSGLLADSVHDLGQPILSPPAGEVPARELRAYRSWDTVSDNRWHDFVADYRVVPDTGALDLHALIELAIVRQSSEAGTPVGGPWFREVLPLIWSSLQLDLQVYGVQDIDFESGAQSFPLEDLEELPPPDGLPSLPAGTLPKVRLSSAIRISVNTNPGPRPEAKAEWFGFVGLAPKLEATPGSSVSFRTVGRIGVTTALVRYANGMLVQFPVNYKSPGRSKIEIPAGASPGTARIVRMTNAFGVSHYAPFEQIRIEIQ